MSWVRWSSTVSKGVSSDLYIYDSVGDFIALMVAGRKRVSIKPIEEIPEEPDFHLIESNQESWLSQYHISEDWWDEKNENINWIWKDINEKWSGQSLEFTDIDSLIETLKEMRAEGIVFPDYVFEQAEEARTEYE
jgi:hypothetical protein